MSDIVRHKGYITNTGTRCSVVFRELPGDPEHCLIIESDSLPEVYRDAVAQVVSREGQNTKDLYEALNQAMMPTGENMLTALHSHRLLKRRETTEITMVPTASYKVRLDELNKQLNAITEVSSIKQPESLQKKLNPFESVAEEVNEADGLNIAKNLLIQASDLIKEAERKRERAFLLRPEMKPAEAEKTSSVIEIDIKNMSQKDALAKIKEAFKGQQKDASHTE